MQDLLDILSPAQTCATKKTRKKVSEDGRLRMSLAAKTRDPEVVRKNMQKLGKKPKRMTVKRLENLRRQQQTLSTREDNSRGGKKTFANPANRRKIMRNLKYYVNLTDEQFEEKMKELDKKYEQQTADQQTSSDITSKVTNKEK